MADDRVRATVPFTDIVNSTRRAAESGDRGWHALIDAHDAVARSQLARFRGREVNTSGDGFLAMTDGPLRAIRCAMVIRGLEQALGIEVRAGLHIGECEDRGDDIGGIAVHSGARVGVLAGPNDVLVSITLRDLLIGSGLEFGERGALELKGVPGEKTGSRLSLRAQQDQQTDELSLAVGAGLVEDVMKMGANRRGRDRQLLRNLLQILAMHHAQRDLGFGLGEAVQSPQQGYCALRFVLWINDQNQGHWLPEWLIGITAVGGQHVNHEGPLTRGPKTAEGLACANGRRFAGEGLVYCALQLLIGTRACRGEAS